MQFFSRIVNQLLVCTSSVRQWSNCYYSKWIFENEA